MGRRNPGGVDLSGLVVDAARRLREAGVRLVIVIGVSGGDVGDVISVSEKATLSDAGLALMVLKAMERRLVDEYINAEPVVGLEKHGGDDYVKP